MKSNRREKMEAFIIKHNRVSMDTLMEEFRVSKNTVRHDIKYLERNGLIRKVYGGVEKIEDDLAIDFNERNLTNRVEKSKIAESAAKQIEEGDIIFCDSGTTIRNILNFISNEIKCTLITNNLDIIISSIDKPNVEVISLPGTLRRSTKSFTSQDTINQIEKYNISKCFISVSGISDDGMLTNSSQLECDIKRTAIEQSKIKILTCDASKFKKSMLFSFYQLDQMDLIITSRTSDNHINNLLSDLSCIIIDK